MTIRSSSSPRRVVILGGGFGGVTVAQELEKLTRGDARAVQVTLVSQTNYLLFLPMLAEAAAGSVELTHVLSPLRALLPKTDIRVEMVESIDLASRTVATRDAATMATHVLQWDALVIALGSTVSLTGMQGVAEHGLPIKTIGDALSIRNRAVHMLEAAAAMKSRDARASLLTFVVCGAGFSGVEMAAELLDYLVDSVKLYSHIDRSEIRIVLLQSGARILPEISEKLAAFAHRKLQARGVEIRLGARLASATATRVHLTDGHTIATRTLIVAIGAGPNPVLAPLDVPKERGRLRVDERLQIIGRDDVWALGDCAAVPLSEPGIFAPPTAQFALREGHTVGKNVHAALTGRTPTTFQFRGLGQMVSLGHHSAVAELGGRVQLAGLPAWLLWRSFYLMRLPGLDRKLRVWLDWNLDLFFRRDLAQLNVERSERIASANYDVGEDIISQGDLADAFYVIERGEVQVLRMEDGREREVARLGPGDTFGEVALLRQQRRNATVRALTLVEVIVVTRGDFDQLVGTWRALATTIESAAVSRNSGAPDSPNRT
ncbi:MAG: FAD-dependent oxidoreductase [Chloroflexota bacterium]